MKTSSSIFLIAVCVLLGSCTYLKYTAIQAKYSRIQNAAPGQLNLKHMIDRETFYVIGHTLEKTCECSEYQMAVAAYSDKFTQNERVDIMYFANSGTHFGLNLPEGHYRLVAFADKNENSVFEGTEVVGLQEFELRQSELSENVLGPIKVELVEPRYIDWVEEITIPKRIASQKSLFFPGGTIRSLNDTLFDKGVVTLGMYDPASFLEMSPTMFYALEENVPYKIPVVFVHGIDGSPREFSSMIENLDRDRYKPWFFYFPSGGDLDQLATLFHRIFLSGKVIPQGSMPMIVVAHSMGGLVVREAINKYEGDESENKIELLVTIATPFGGHPAAAIGEKHGLIVLPAWRDLNPDNIFIKSLYRKPMPEFINHHLLYAYDDDVVPLSSQLYPQAQAQSREQFGFNESHTGILNNPEVMSYIDKNMSQVVNFFPKSHLSILITGGYDVSLGDDYSPLSKHIFQTLGKYISALVKGEIKPISPDQVQFIRVAKGELPPKTELERDWLKFIAEHPDI